MAKVIIFGAAQCAELIYHYLANDTSHKISAFTVNETFRKGDELLSHPLVSFETIEKKFSPNSHKMILFINDKNMGITRKKLYEQAKKKGYEFISYVSSKAILNDNVIGENTIIMENAHLQPYTSVGENTIIWPRTLIGHHTKIGSHVFISPSIVGGCCTVGDHCYLSMNTTVNSRIHLGEGTLTDISSVIKQDTQPWGVYSGSPAIKRRAKSDRVKF